MGNLNELRREALAFISSGLTRNWIRSAFIGGDSPQDAQYWYIEGHPELSHWPFPADR